MFFGDGSFKNSSKTLYVHKENPKRKNARMSITVTPFPNWNLFAFYLAIRITACIPLSRDT